MSKKSKKSLRTKGHKALCKAIAEGRLYSGMTQAQVADLLDWKQSDISKVENGGRRIDVIEFIELCNVLEIDPEIVIRNLNAIFLKG